jgi:hypothetical protein
MEWLEVRDSVSEVEEERSRGRDLKASRRGVRMRTCWHTTREGMNLDIGFSIYNKRGVNEVDLPSSWREVFIDVRNFV